MRVLITGAGGFVGNHLITHLREADPDADIHGTVRTTRPLDTTGTTFHTLDLRAPDAVEDLISTIQPDHIYHMAAQTFVPRSFEAPWETLETNIRSQVNLIQACLKHDLKPRILVVASAEIYGVVTPEDLPIVEDRPLAPSSPYGVSKVAQDVLGAQYFRSHELPIMRARPFNHFGPGQNERFVAPAFASQIARIEAGEQAPKIRVGDLSAKRDFTDVRDIVRAYGLIMEKGTPGEAYNVASGQARSIQELLDTLIRLAGVDITVEVDESRLRPVNIPELTGSIARLQAATGWAPERSFEDTLLDVLNDCRARVGTA